MQSRPASLTCCLALLILPDFTFAADSRTFLNLLRRHGERSESNLESELRSGMIAAVLPHHQDGEVAVLGATRMPLTLEFYLERFRDVADFRKSPSVLGIGKFDVHPDEHTLNGLTLEQKQAEALKECRPGKCALKLSVAMMNRMRVITGSEALSRGYRNVLWAYIANYIQKGTPAMINYADKEPPASAATTFLSILAEFRWLRDYAPELAAALNAPYQTSDGVEEFLYWSKEEFGLKATINVTHVFICRAVIDSRPWAFIASKQIYADHYLNGSLGLTVLESESTDVNNPAVSVAYFNRSVTDGLRGWLASIQRTILERRARAAVEQHLNETKQRLTKAYREQLR